MNALTTDKVIRKYLAGHCEDTAKIGASIGRPFKDVVVIPAYGEGEILDHAIASVPDADGKTTLAVVVINERVDSTDSVKRINTSTCKRLQQRYGEHRQLSHNALLCEAPFGALALVRVTMPRDQGVGLARKHGADLAFGAWAAGLIDSPWIHCTDADVQLPADYFCTPDATATVALHRFRHEASHTAAQAHVRIYDLWLRLHALGLHWAGSPYAFHTIGSTITVKAQSYAAVRGFPRRKAAEDFYLLNKLAKLGPVVTAASAPLRIAARVSDRVPFGTGRAMGLAERGGSAALPRFYHPRVYVYLKTVLQVMRSSCDSGVFDRQSLLASISAQGFDLLPVIAALDALGFDAAINALLRSCAEPEQRQRALHCWFDAFRTMKFIHHLRDNGVASVDLRAAIAAGPFLVEQCAPSLQDDLGVVRETLDELKAPPSAGVSARRLPAEVHTVDRPL